MRTTAQNLVPPPEELAKYAEQDKRDALSNARLQNVARALAHDAADALEPDAGQPIDDATRDRLAAALQRVLVEHLPPLRNLAGA
ncbi:hypothetical protein AQ611_10935 [Burkholderia singularis]|nr:hypothetical protein AQ611_10935 [Burkholderia sp. Bp7605]